MHSSPEIALDANAPCRRVHITQSQHGETANLEAAYPIQKQNNIKMSAFLHGSVFMCGTVLENFCFDTDFLWLIPPKRRSIRNPHKYLSDSFNNFSVFSLFRTFPEGLNFCLGM